MTGLLNRLSGVNKDTICALASAPGQAGISVVRVSGPQALQISQQLCPFLPQKPESHRVYYGHLIDPSSKTSVDEVLVSYFREGRSFTGEETLEISLHGNPTLVGQTLDLLHSAGARQAERGEFTFRGFMNGRVDLVQAESVLELIQSQSRKAASLSLRQLQGGLSKSLSDLKNRITEVLAHLEANIDFSTEDIEIAQMNELIHKTQMIQRDILHLLQGYKAGRILKSGYQVVLIGRPNVGKSSLLNGLLEEEKAIVTSIPGTTRDLIEGFIYIDGYHVELIDTAGLRESNDQVERLGQDKAKDRIQTADLIILLLDSSQAIHEDEVKLLKSIDKSKTILVLNKADLPTHLDTHEYSELSVLKVSALKNLGLEALKAEILRRLLAEVPNEASTVSLNARHFEHLTNAQKMLGESLTLMVNDQSPDLIALDLHRALREIYAILGEVYDDQVMDQVFGQFCIGK